MADQASIKTTKIITVLQSSLEGAKAVLPDSAIAEIVDFQTTSQESEGMPSWYLGKLDWRTIQVPLISLESLNNGSFFTKTGSLKIIVMHGSSSRKKLPYWAFVVLETPKMMRIDSSDLLESSSDGSLGEVEISQARLNDQEVMIPNVNKIEKEIISLLYL